MVSTYWSVSVTVRMAHTEITEIGIRIAASTRSTQAEMYGADARAGALPSFVEVLAFFRSWPASAVSEAVVASSSASASGPASTPFASSGCIWGSVSLIWAFPLALPSAKWTGAHAFLGVRLLV